MIPLANAFLPFIIDLTLSYSSIADGLPLSTQDLSPPVSASPSPAFVGVLLVFMISVTVNLLHDSVD